MFIGEKCKNQMHGYKIRDPWLHPSICEKNLGVVVDLRSSLSQQCATAAKRANAVLGGGTGKSLKSHKDIKRLGV